MKNHPRAETARPLSPDAARPVLCIGAALWDIIARTPSPLHPGADVPGRIDRQPGGVALNVALVLAALGRPAALLAAVGRDADGDRLLAEATARGVDCAAVLRHDAPTDSYLAIEGAAGEVFAAVADCAGLERAGLAVLRPLTDGTLARPWTGWIVADGNLPLPVLTEIATAPAFAGACVAFVPASPAKAARLAPALAHGRGALYLNRREAEAICARPFPDSRAAARALLDRGLAEAIVTDGPAPASHAGPAGVVTGAPPPVATRSLTGAGDAFLAGHLAACIDGFDPEAALAAALQASARHITREAS